MKCEECERHAEGHKWAKIRAHEEGWFFTKDGKAYCPDHVPSWVTAWRARNANR